MFLENNDGLIFVVWDFQNLTSCYLQIVSWILHKSNIWLSNILSKLSIDLWWVIFLKSKSVIPMTDVFQFILILVKYAKFPKFDIFFRKYRIYGGLNKIIMLFRIIPDEWDSPEITSQLDNFENIKYAMTKQSIHIQKFKNLEICE